MGADVLLTSVYASRMETDRRRADALFVENALQLFGKENVGELRCTYRCRRSFRGNAKAGTSHVSKRSGAIDIRSHTVRLCVSDESAGFEVPPVSGLPVHLLRVRMSAGRYLDWAWLST